MLSPISPPSSTSISPISKPVRLDIEIKIEGKQLKLFVEDVLVPPGNLGQPVIRDHVGTDLRLGEAFDPNDRHRL